MVEHKTFPKKKLGS